MSNVNLFSDDSTFGNTKEAGCAIERAYNLLCQRMPIYTTADATDVQSRIRAEGQRFCDTMGDDVQYLDTATVTDFECIFTCYNPEAEETLYNAFKDEEFMVVTKMEKGVSLKYQGSSFELEEIRSIIVQDKNHRIIFAFLVAVFETLGCKTIW